MKKLQKIAIKNFQCIQDAVVHLGNITILTGKSRSGKSAFYRAVKGAVENLAGDTFITFGEKETRVRLDDVLWVQSKTKNKYIILDPDDMDSEVDVFEKCGRSVPEGIQKRLNMGRVEFGDGVQANLNFCDQLGNIFFVQGKTSDNAKVIGSITDLHTVYNGMRNAQRDLQEKRSEVKEKILRLDEIEKRKIEIEDSFEITEAKFKIISEVYETAKRIEARAEKLNGIRQRFSSNSVQKNQVLNRLNRYEFFDFDSIREDCEKVKQTESKIHILQNVGKRFRENSERIHQVANILTCYGVIDFERARAGCEKIGRLEHVSVEYARHKAVTIDAEGRYTDIQLVLDDEPRITLKRIESLLELKSGADKICGVRAELDRMSDVLDSRLNDNKKLLDGFDVCDSCGAKKEHWNL